MSQLDYRVFTATRPGLTPDIPAGYESLAWVANSATLIYGTRDGRVPPVGVEPTL
jgi:hypothetical protein